MLLSKHQLSLMNVHCRKQCQKRSMQFWAVESHVFFISNRILHQRELLNVTIGESMTQNTFVTCLKLKLTFLYIWDPSVSQFYEACF